MIKISPWVITKLVIHSDDKNFLLLIYFLRENKIDSSSLMDESNITIAWQLVKVHKYFFQDTRFTFVSENKLIPIFCDTENIISVVVEDNTFKLHLWQKLFASLACSMLIL